MKKTLISEAILPILIALVLLILWTWVSYHNSALRWLFPRPWEVIKVFFTHSDLLWQHFLYTLCETLAGLLLSIFSGVLTAILMDRWKLFYRAVYPFIIISQTIPIIAMSPLIILWLGYGITAKIFIVALVCFFPIAMNLYDGLQQVSIDNIRLMRSMNASQWQIFHLLKLPSALPSFFSGVKLSVSYSVMAAIIGEWLGGEKGLGIYMTRATKSYQTTHVFAIILIIIVFSLVLYYLVVALERRLFRWRYTRLDEYLDV